jgi:uncharacterized membrane protein YphA (DoxX/SURF4 family)
MRVKVGSTWESRTLKAVLLIRILVGWVFLSEGIQKFLLPDSRSRPLRENRHSVAAGHGTVCRSG